MRFLRLSFELFVDTETPGILYIMACVLIAEEVKYSP